MRKPLATAIAATVLMFSTSVFAQGLTDDIAFDVINNTSAVITALHISTSTDPNWGDDIAVDYIQPGATMEVTITDNLPDCDYDVQVEFSDGHTQEIANVNLCTLNGQTVTVQ